MTVQRRVRILDSHLADQIAAGEVVERPASVLKELVENCLDAGAGRIHVGLEDGGTSLLSVEDDGQGIIAEDLPLALARHATSKIQSLSELDAIRSFGFRGEALPAIASVSRLEIISRAAESATGTVLRVDGGRLLRHQPAARAPGTTVTVQDLFFNVPARRKFLKSQGVELGRVQKAWRQIALSQFAVTLRLSHGGRLLSHYPSVHTPDGRDSRVAAILGEEFLRNALFFDQEHLGMHLWGWMALPAYSRARADDQYFFVNGRPVRDASLSHALRSAYGDVLYHGRHPVGICYLELPPESVDVNVHPAKSEVRFRDGKLVYDFIRHNLARVLAEEARPLVPAVFPLAGRNGHPGLVREHLPPERDAAQISLRAAQPVDSPGGASSGAAPLEIRGRNAVLRLPEKVEDEKSDATDSGPVTDFPLGYAIGQVHHRFIVAQNARGLVLVDQHAAHERIIYERLKHRKSGMSRQHLLVPVTVSLSPAQMERLDGRAMLLSEAGLDWSRSGPGTVSLHAGPADIAPQQYGQLLEDCLDEDFPWEPGNEDARLAAIACRAAVKDHHVLTLEDMNALLRQLEQTPRYSQCNHGRPTVVQMDFRDLDRLFLRGR